MDINALLPTTTEGWAHLGIVGALSGLAVLTAIGVVAFNSPIRSALSLVLNFFTLAFIYFSLGAELLGITQIIVYTGAIMVLFLFVIMLLNLSADDPSQYKKDAKPVFAGLIGLVLFGLLSTAVLAPLKAINQISAPDRSEFNPIGWGSPQAVGKTLFTGYVWPFEMISLLLLVGIVGSILLARRKVTS